jgi:surface antigen
MTFIRSARGWGALLAVLTLTAASLLQVAGTKLAFASYANSYSWPSAPCADSGSVLGQTSGTGYWCSGYNWGESPCPSGDGYCSTGNELNGYYLYDKYGYGFRNCTSYVASEIAKQFSVNVSGWGNAADWDTNALAAHYANDTSPQVGDIAQWNATPSNSYGHVAYVYAVNSGVASYAQYNYGEDGNYTDTYTSASTSQGAPDNYIHIGTIQQGNPLYQYAITSSSYSHTDITKTVGGTYYGVYGTPSELWGSTVQVFAVGPTGQLLDYENTGSGFYPVTVESSTVLSKTGGVTAVQVGSSEEIFAVGSNNRLYQFANSGSGWTTTDITYLGWTVQGSPSVVWGSTPNVFVAGTNGNLLQYSFTGTQWYPYTLPSSSTLTGGVTATQVGSGFQVFENGTSNHLLQTAFSGGWTYDGITYPGYVVQGGPSVVWGSYANIFTIGENAGNGSDGDLLEYDLPPGGTQWVPYPFDGSTALSGGTTSVLVGSTYEVFAD